MLYRIKEYGKIRSEKDFPNLITNDSEVIIPDHSFSSIWNFILEFQSTEPTIEKAFKLLTKGGKRIIQAQNYVGLIETVHKITIEIFPKIYSKDGEANLDVCRNVFLKMVSSLRDTPFISVQTASLEVRGNFPILEIFIRNFVQEVNQIIARGLKKEYVKTNSNSGYLKGQLLFSENIIRNLVDGSKFYIRFNRYDLNIPQNKLIKSALRKLKSISVSSTNLHAIEQLLSVFYEVDYSSDIENDIRKCTVKSRLFVHYEKSIQWAGIFLTNRSFTTFSGDAINQSILFPMQLLFESYIASLFQKHTSGYKLHTQHNKFFLVDEHRNKGKFRLKPDLVIESADNRCFPFVMDTKWKIVNENLMSKNYLVSQADMYQLYAYGRKYIKNNICPGLVLIYPKNEFFNNRLHSFLYETDCDIKMELIAFPFDLCGDYRSQILNILNHFQQNNMSFL